MTVRLVVDIIEPAVSDQDVIDSLFSGGLRSRSLSLVSSDGLRYVLDPVALGKPAEIDNSDAATRAVEQHMGLPGEEEK